MCRAGLCVGIGGTSVCWWCAISELTATHHSSDRVMCNEGGRRFSVQYQISTKSPKVNLVAEPIKWPNVNSWSQELARCLRK